MKIRLILLIVLFPLFSSAHDLLSPDGKIKIVFSLTDESIQRAGVPRGTPFYEVFFEGKPFLLPSRLGFDVVGTAEIKHYLEIGSVERSQVRSSWKPVYGERDQYPDNYNEMRVILHETLYPNRALHIVFRAYDEGVAFRYEIPSQPGFEKVTISREYTEFAFPRYASVWESYGHEGKYYKVYPSEVKPDCELPLTCTTVDGIYGAIMEAGTSHYPRAYVEAPARNQNTLRIDLRGEAKGANGIQTAWRAMTLSDTPGGLIEKNYLLLNLGEPSKLEDTSWIKPGTVMRETTMATPEVYKMIDFCARKGIDYMLFDWGWYGKADTHTADPSIVQVAEQIARGYPDHPGLDLPGVIKYGAEKGVGVILYVNVEGVERYPDKAFPLFRQWGVKGIKPGFVRTGNQDWQEWTENLVAKAAENHLMVDIHDAYRPNGLSRTWPNLLTQEGIHGNEQNPNADHDAMLPFTRFTIGAGDYTPGYLRGELQSTWAHKLALPIVYYSPLQCLFWREKPSEGHERPELKLWENIPTVWNDTKVLSGEIGEYIVMARRSGSTWYIGGITNTKSRIVEVDLSFLSPGRKYTMTLYNDNKESDSIVDVTDKRISNREKFQIPLKASGGFAIKISEL